MGEACAQGEVGRARAAESGRLDAPASHDETQRAPRAWTKACPVPQPSMVWVFSAWKCKWTKSRCGDLIFGPIWELRLF